ncbi:hypothetical protein JW835_13290 [bacterium]|nr:hypothetical protein [bacterium]
MLAELGEPDENNPEVAFCRHRILDAGGNPGDREMVFDWSANSDYAEFTPFHFTFFLLHFVL